MCVYMYMYIYLSIYLSIYLFNQYKTFSVFA